MTAEIGQLALATFSFVLGLFGAAYQFLKNDDFTNELIRYKEACEAKAAEKINGEIALVTEHFRGEIRRILEYPVANLQIEDIRNLNVAALSADFSRDSICIISDASFYRRKFERAHLRCSNYRWPSYVLFTISFALAVISAFYQNNTMLIVIIAYAIIPATFALWQLGDLVIMKNLEDKVGREYGIPAGK